MISIQNMFIKLTIADAKALGGGAMFTVHGNGNISSGSWSKPAQAVREAIAANSNVKHKSSRPGKPGKPRKLKKK